MSLSETLTLLFYSIILIVCIYYDDHCLANLKRDMFYNKALENDETEEIILKLKNQ